MNDLIMSLFLCLIVGLIGGFIVGYPIAFRLGVRRGHDEEWVESYLRNARLDAERRDRLGRFTATNRRARQ